MREDSGSISLQTLGVILFAAAAGSACAAFILSARAISAKADPVQGRDAAIAAVGEVINALDADTDPRADSPLDPLYSLEAPEGISLEIREVSSRLNPNWLRKGILEDTGLRRLLLPGKSAQELQQFREDQGIQTELSAYTGFFTEEALRDELGVHSYAHLDSGDEFALRKLFLAATADASEAAAFHARLQAHLMKMTMADADELKSVIGLAHDETASVLGIEPQLNVNFASRAALEAVLGYPAHGLEDADRKASALIAQRERRALGMEDIAAIIGLKPPHPIYAYLGSRSWFWSVRIKSEGAAWEAVIARELPDAMDAALGKTPKARLVSFAEVEP